MVKESPILIVAPPTVLLNGRGCSYGPQRLAGWMHNVKPTNSFEQTREITPD